MILPEDKPYPRDAKTLATEVDAVNRVKDIRTLERVKDASRAHWWEAGLVLLLFVSGSGFIVTIYQILPRENELLFSFTFFWFLLLIFSLIATVEFLLAKIRALRKLYEQLARDVETLEQRHRHLTEAKQPPAEPPTNRPRT